MTDDLAGPHKLQSNETLLLTIAIESHVIAECFRPAQSRAAAATINRLSEYKAAASPGRRARDENSATLCKELLRFSPLSRRLRELCVLTNEGEDLFHAADCAMYGTKSAGRNWMFATAPATSSVVPLLVCRRTER